MGKHEVERTGDGTEMSNDGKRIEGAAKKRRDYVLYKAGAGAAICVGLFLFLVFGLLTLAVGWTALALLLAPISEFQAFLGCLGVTGVTGAVTCLCLHTVLKTHNKSAGALYIPPVAEQLAALPARQILVRGSDRPAAAPWELVRAANYVKPAKPEELLRPISGATQ